MNRRVIIVLVAVLALAGCDSVGDSVGWSGEMDMQEAADRADEILDETFAGINPTVQWVHGEDSAGSCDLSRRRAVVTVISAERRGSFLGVVERQWEKSGYRQIGVNENSDSPATYFETPDGFRVRLLIGGGGQAFFEVATPCVKASQVKPPAQPPGSEGRAGQAMGTPNIRSDFWSAGAP